MSGCPVCDTYPHAVKRALDAAGRTQAAIRAGHANRIVHVTLGPVLPAEPGIDAAAWRIR